MVGWRRLASILREGRPLPRPRGGAGLGSLVTVRDYPWWNTATDSSESSRTRRAPLTSTPAAVISEFAREQADMVALATHGRGGIRRWLLGSEAGSAVPHTAATRGPESTRGVSASGGDRRDHCRPRAFHEFSIGLDEDDAVVLRCGGRNRRGVCRCAGHPAGRQDHLAHVVDTQDQFLSLGKAGLGGRAELAAFFLEDLMLPTEDRETGDGAAGQAAAPLPTA